MIDPDQIQIVVSELHRIAKSPHGVSQNQIEPLLKKHREVIDELSERLAIVAGWLDKGLITEAMHLEGRFPPLLETLKQVGLGDSRPVLVKVSDQLGIDRPALPAKKMIERLRASKDQYILFESGLREYRECCILKRSPKRRLEILSNLRLRDPKNSVWLQEIGKLESVRIIEINREAKEFYKQQDSDSLEVLLEELKKFDWESSPPKQLIEEIARRRDLILSVRSEKEIEVIFEKIKKLFYLKDKNKVAHLFNQLKTECQSKYSMLAIEKIREENEEIFSWVDLIVEEAERHEESKILFDQLEYALDKKSSISEIDKIVWKVEDLGAPIPPGLSSRVADARARERDERKRFLVFRVGGSFLLGSILVFISYIFIENSKDQKNRINISIALESFEKDYLTDGIDLRLKKLDNLLTQAADYLDDVKIQELVAGVKEIKSERAKEVAVFKRDIEAIWEGESCEGIFYLLPKISLLIRGNVELEDDYQSAEIHVSNLCDRESFERLSTFQKEMENLVSNFILVENKIKDKINTSKKTNLKQEENSLRSILRAARLLKVSFQDIDESDSISLFIDNIEKAVQKITTSKQKEIEYESIYADLSSAVGEADRIDLLNDLKIYDSNNERLIRAANASGEIKAQVDWRGMSPNKNLLKVLDNFEKVEYWKECCKTYLDKNHGMGTTKRDFVRRLFELLSSSAYLNNAQIISGFPERIRWFFDERLSILPVGYGAICYHVNEYSFSEDPRDRGRFSFNRVKNTEALGEIIKEFDRYKEFASEPIPPWELLKNYYVKANLGMNSGSYSPNPLGAWKSSPQQFFLDSLLSLINLVRESYDGNLDPMPAFFFVRKALKDSVLNLWSTEWIAQTESLSHEILESDWADPGNDLTLDLRSKARKELGNIFNLINQNKKTFQKQLHEIILGAEKFYYCGYLNRDLETQVSNFVFIDKFNKNNSYVYVFLYNPDQGVVEVVKIGELKDSRMVVDLNIEPMLAHGIPLYIRQDFEKGMKHESSSSNKE